MLFTIRYFLKRVMREGAKSLAVPLLAFTLIVLINTLGGIKEWLDYEFINTMENHPIIAELSDLTGEKTDELAISMDVISLFTQPDSPVSLYEHTGEIILKRSLDTTIVGSDIETTLTGITSITLDDNLDPEAGVFINFFDGYDESIFKTTEPVCIIGEDMLAMVENGKLKIASSVQMPGELDWYADPEKNHGITASQTEWGTMLVAYEYEENNYMFGELRWMSYEDLLPYLEEADFKSTTFDYYMTAIVSYSVPVLIQMTIVYTEGEVLTSERELTVAGTVSGADSDVVYAPFWTVIDLLEEFEEYITMWNDIPFYAESLSIIVADNRELTEFKNLASLSFSRVRPVRSTLPFAMTIYDSTFYETIEPLMQNTVLVEIAIPIVYVIAVSVGFLASTLLTRQRKSEFAVMRSVGIHRRDVFTGVFSEQLILSLTGAVFGCGLTFLIFRDITFLRPAILIGCYLLGTIFAAIRVAGTNVLKVMKDKE